MGRNKIDKLKLIEDRLQRTVTFCKRRKGLLKKAIELSSLCQSKIFIVIHDEERERTIQFSSDEAYTL